ncbi:unnamed protein product [Closterium sp. NIES-53]
MASLRVLAFDHEGRPVQFDTWLNDLQLYLLSDSKDSVSLFDLASCAATAPPITTDTQDSTGQRRTAQDDALVTCYSSPATAALGRLLLPYLFHELSAFTIVKDLVSHLRASDSRYRAAVLAEFLDRNPPPMFVTLYFIVTHLPDSLRSVRDHFLSLDPTSLTVDLLEQHLLAVETSAVAVGAARGTPHPPFFEGCSPSPLAPSYASAAAAGVSIAEDVGAASASAKRRSSKGKSGQGGGGGSGGGGGGSGSGGGGSSGGEFSSDLLRDFCRGEGILQSFTLPDSPQQNGIAERRIGLVVEVARTSMIHAAAPHFLWLFAVRYAAHQLNFWPRVSLPKTSPTLHWTGEVGDASVFRFLGSLAFVRDTSADKLSPRAIPYVFLGFVPDEPGWQFYHPTSRCVFPSQDVTFDESVPFYHLFPYRSAPPPPPPLFHAPGPPPVDPLPPQGPAPSGVSQVDPLPGHAPLLVVVKSGATRVAASGGAEPEGAESGGAETGHAELGGAETGGAEPGGVATGVGEPGSAEPEGVEPGGAASQGAEPPGSASSGGSVCASPSLSPQQLREWFVCRTHLRRGASGAGGAGAAGGGGTVVAAGAGVTGGTETAGPGGARTRGTRVAGTGGVEGAGAGDLPDSGTTGAGGAGAGGAGVGGAGGPGVGGADAGGAGAVSPGGAVRPRAFFVPLLQQVLGTPPSADLPPPLLCPPPNRQLPPLQPSSPLPAPSPYSEQSGGLTERHELASRPVSPVHTALRVSRLHPPSVPGTHAMTLRPSSVPLRVPLLAPPGSSLPEVPDPKSDRTRAASPTASCLLTTAVTDPSFESAAVSALVAGLLDFAAACRLDYASALVDESVSATPPSVGGECALGTDVIEDKQEDFECLAAAVPCFVSMLLAPEGDPDAPDIRPRALTQRRLRVLQCFGFQFSSPQPTPLSTSHSLSAPPSDESVEPSGLYPELVGSLMYLMTCTRTNLAYPLSLLARYVALGRHRKEAHDGVTSGHFEVEKTRQQLHRYYYWPEMLTDVQRHVASVIVTTGLNVPKTKDRVHRRISAQRLQTLIAFRSQLQMT